MSWKEHRIVKFLGAPTISPIGFLIWATTLVLVWLAMEAFGLRAYATMISGTVPMSGLSESRALMLGTIYVLVYFMAILVAPVLLVGAGIFAVLDRIIPKPKDPPQAQKYAYIPPAKSLVDHGE